MGINYKVSDFYHPVLRILQDGADGRTASEIIQILIITKNIDALRLPELWSTFRLKIKNQIRLAKRHLTTAGFIQKTAPQKAGWYLTEKGKNTNIKEEELIKLVRVEVRKEKNKYKSNYAIGENGKIVKELSRNAYSRQKREYVYGKNVIFYGPPATGKTQEAINLALQILKIDAQDEQKKKQVFREYIGNQIEFITFHQSYTYEDFIQGLRPFTNNQNLGFELKDGVFKRIADRARQHYEAYQKSKKQKQIPFEVLLERLLIEKVNPDTEEIELEVENPQGIYNTLLIYEITDTQLFYKRKTKRDVVKEEQRELHTRKLKNLFESQNLSQDPLNAKYYNAVLQALHNLAENTPSAENAPAELQNYIIIIDEINRANIASVFGELITLIEPDKRIGQVNELFITLPSGETFGVPPNLYIIGTMNTADKSIASLDIALRRRFEFLPMYPQYSAKGIAYPDLLRAINQQIKEKKGIDFMIGQAYFLAPEFDLIRTLNRQIIPLLNEYFNFELDKVKKILGNALEQTPSTAGKFEVDEDENFLLKVVRATS